MRSSGFVHHHPERLRVTPFTLIQLFKERSAAQLR